MIARKLAMVLLRTMPSLDGRHGSVGDGRRGSAPARRILQAGLALMLLGWLAGCATESHRTVQPQQVTSAGTPYAGSKSTLVVGKFDNRSSYMRDTDTFSDFSIMYAVSMNELWYYPRAYKNN